VAASVTWELAGIAADKRSRAITGTKIDFQCISHLLQELALIDPPIPGRALNFTSAMAKQIRTNYSFRRRPTGVGAETVGKLIE
jgi:hypothetical protein